MAINDNKSRKAMGFMRQVQKDCFSMRLRIAGGQIKANQLKKVCELAQIYGHGYVHLTARQGIEIPFIRIENLEIVQRELSGAGLELGSSGPRVRAITACMGNTVCPKGLIETTELADELDKRYFGKDLPHKFKLGVTGCNNNCLKAEENDLGIKGGVQPFWQKTNCNFCGICEAICPGKAINLQKGEAKLDFSQEQCLNCGKCVKSCPAGAWEGKSGFLLFIGGTLGTQCAAGKQMLPIVSDKEDLFKLIDAVLEFFIKHGKAKERFRHTIERVGWELLEQKLVEIMTTKTEAVDIVDIVAR